MSEQLYYFIVFCGWAYVVYRCVKYTRWVAKRADLSVWVATLAAICFPIMAIIGYALINLDEPEDV